MEGLKIGESAIVPGGYFGAEGGHGVIYEVKREGEDLFRFSLFNTGEGALFGQGWFGSLRAAWNHRVAAVSFKGLSKEAVTAPSFWIDLLNIATQNDAEHSMERVHNRLLTHLVEKHKAKQELLEAHELQTWGTCAFDSVMCYLQWKLSKKVFAAFDLFIMNEAKGRLGTLLLEANVEKTFTKPTLDLIERKAKTAIDAHKEDYRDLFLQDKEWLLAKEIVPLLSDQNNLQSHVDSLLKRQRSLERKTGIRWYSDFLADPKLVERRQAVSKQIQGLSAWLKTINPDARIERDAELLTPHLRRLHGQWELQEALRSG
jgi:hypothetical protein